MVPLTRSEADTTAMIAYAREVLTHESTAVASLVDRIDESFCAAVDMILECEGRVVVTGMGKPFLVGAKISATLASTGTPSLPLNAAEAYHGDLGRVCPNDVLLILSNSGETREIVQLLDPIKKIGARIIALTGNRTSELGANSDIVLWIGDLDEACPLGLAPSTTTTAMLAVGDALALAVLKRRGFTPDDYAFYHPGGSLGRKLMKVEEVMRRNGRCPVIEQSALVREALIKITAARAGSILIVDAAGKLMGIFTDGDVRRHIMQRGPDVILVPIGDVMTRKPVTIQKGRLASEAMRILKERKIDELPVIDEEGRPVGLVDVQDILGLQ